MKVHVRPGDLVTVIFNGTLAPMETLVLQTKREVLVVTEYRSSNGLAVIRCGQDSDRGSYLYQYVDTDRKVSESFHVDVSQDGALLRLNKFIDE